MVIVTRQNQRLKEHVQWEVRTAVGLALFAGCRSGNTLRTKQMEYPETQNKIKDGKNEVKKMRTLNIMS